MSRLFHRHRRLLIGGAAAVALLVGAAVAAGLVSRGGSSNGGSSSSGGAIAALLPTTGAGAPGSAAKAIVGSSSAGTAHTTPTVGRVQSVQTSATDVTSRAVDLNARLIQAQRVDRRLLDFLARATTVSEALAVQTRIDATELRGEELRGELKALRQQVTYGTLTVSIAERAPRTVAPHRNSFLAALSSSWRHLPAGLAAMIVGFGIILPFVVLLAVLALVAWYGARVAARLRSRPRLER